MDDFINSIRNGAGSAMRNIQSAFTPAKAQAQVNGQPDMIRPIGTFNGKYPPGVPTPPPGAVYYDFSKNTWVTEAQLHTPPPGATPPGQVPPPPPGGLYYDPSTGKWVTGSTGGGGIPSNQPPPGGYTTQAYGAQDTAPPDPFQVRISNPQAGGQGVDYTVQYPDAGSLGDEMIREQQYLQSQGKKIFGNINASAKEPLLQSRKIINDYMNSNEPMNVAPRQGGMNAGKNWEDPMMSIQSQNDLDKMDWTGTNGQPAYHPLSQSAFNTMYAPGGHPAIMMSPTYPQGVPRGDMYSDKYTRTYSEPYTGSTQTTPGSALPSSSGPGLFMGPLMRANQQSPFAMKQKIAQNMA